MNRWSDFAEAAPELAGKVRHRLEAAKHHVLATVRRDGSPRVSGTEVQIHRGDLTIGSMPGAMKARDLQHDGRYALHANPGDGSMEGGDAKVAGRAEEVTDPDELARFIEGQEMPPGPFHLFRLHIDQAVLTYPQGNKLVIETWTPEAGLNRLERD
jgi:hypothetical protein